MQISNGKQAKVVRRRGINTLNDARLNCSHCGVHRHVFMCYVLCVCVFFSNRLLIQPCFVVFFVGTGVLC